MIGRSRIPVQSSYLKQLLNKVSNDLVDRDKTIKQKDAKIKALDKKLKKTQNEVRALKKKLKDAQKDKGKGKK